MSEYDDIPGTYVFDGRRSREGYHLNMFCMSLIKEENRRRFATNQAGYLDKFPMSTGQRRAVLDRNWLEMLRLGGNIYYMYKLANFDGHSMQFLGAAMSGVTEGEFREMMTAGGRRVEGGRTAS